MDSHGVDVFHIADGYGSIVSVPDNLIFYFLVAFNAFFHKHLMYGGQLKSASKKLRALTAVICKTAAGAAKSKCGTKHNGITYFLCRRKTFLHAFGNNGFQHRLSYFLTQLLEQLPVLGSLDTAAARTQKLHAALSQHAFLFKLHCKIKSCLPADTGYNGVGSLVADNLCKIFKSQRLHIDLVCNGSVCHNGCGIGVAEHDLIPLLFQGKARLRAGVVKLCRLPDNYGAGAYNKYFFKVSSFRHIICPPSK